jgi:phosphoribosyl 1,2-cyclic phosphate phosphodiesterase
MKITILGCGSVPGVPVWSCKCDVCTSKDKKNHRTRPSLLVQSNEKNIVIDCGPDFSEQMLREKINKIDYMFITHSHLDHTASLGELQFSENLHLEMPKDVMGMLKKKRSIFSYLKTRNPNIKIDVFTSKKIGNVTVDTITVKHDKDIAVTQTPTYGYLFTEGDKRVAYITDFNEIVDMGKMKNLDLFICDGSRMDGMWGHIGIKKAIELFNKIKPKQMLFTHMTHEIEYNKIKEYLSQFGNIKPSYDGMVIEL